MRRVVGAGLLVLGLLLLGLPVAFIAWAHHTYTVGFSLNAQGIATLAVAAALDPGCIGAGLWLLLGPRQGHPRRRRVTPGPSGRARR